MVQWFVENDPDQLTKENMGRLPIHVACLKGASADVVRHLVMLHPESVRARTADPCEMLPLHCVCQCYGIVDNETVRFLLELYPASASVSDRMGFFYPEGIFVSGVTTTFSLFIACASLDHLLKRFASFYASFRNRFKRSIVAVDAFRFTLLA